MSKLSKKEHWDSVHKGEEMQLPCSAIEPAEERGRPSLKRRIVRAIKAALGEKAIERMSGYDEYLLWEVIFKQHLPEMKGAKALEVGSAPGEFLVKFGQRYDADPYGVEYSEVGVDLNRKVFRLHGFNPDNVIHADFFSDEFHKRYKGAFDVVISRGFIEHFSDVEQVIEKHMNLLSPGGFLIVNIPNLRGINYALVHLFNKELIPLHNLEIMREDAFKKLFERDDLQRLFCDYYGVFSFYLFYAKERSPMRFAMNLCHKLQPVLNLAFRSILRNRSAESRLLSPSLLFIGRKLSGLAVVSGYIECRLWRVQEWLVNFRAAEFLYEYL